MQNLSVAAQHVLHVRGCEAALMPEHLEHRRMEAAQALTLQVYCDVEEPVHASPQW